MLIRRPFWAASFLIGSYLLSIRLARQNFKSHSEIITFKTYAELKFLKFFHQNFRDIGGKQVLGDCDSNEAYLLFLQKFGKKANPDNIWICQKHYFCTKFELISSANQPLSNLIKPRNQGSWLSAPSMSSRRWVININWLQAIPGPICLPNR